jgi:hypothetical protein
MSLQTIYIEPSDEITTVIERLKSAHDPVIALVAPKGSLLLQSIVNLKLARKAASDAQKDLILVTTDTVGRNLASQLGILVASTEKEVSAVLQGAVDAPDLGAEPAVISGVRIHRYYDEGSDAPTPTAVTTSAIVPKGMLQESAPVAAVAAAAPTTTTPVTIETTPPETPIARKAIPTEPEPLKKSTIISEEPTLATPTVAPMTPPTDVKPTIPGAIAAAPSTTPPRKRRLALWISLVLILVILGSGGLITSTYYPATTVTVSVRGEVITRDLAFTARRGIDSPSTDLQTIPAEEISVETEQSVASKASTSARVGEQATGTATLVNSQDTDSIPLAAGAILRSDAGRTFVTTVAVVVPGLTVRAGIPINGTISVPIRAEQVGPESNLENTGATLTSPSSTRLFAQITKTSGGTSREAIVIGEADMKSAEEKLQQQITDALTAKLTERMSGRSIVYQESAVRNDVSPSIASAKIGTETADFTISTTAKRTILAIDQATLLRVVESRLKDGVQIPGEFRLNPNVSFSEERTSIPDGVYSFVLKASGVVSPVISAERIGRDIAGMSQVDAQALIQRTNPAATGVQFSASPSWWPFKRLPNSSGRITVTTTYE